MVSNHQKPQQPQQNKIIDLTLLLWSSQTKHPYLECSPVRLSTLIYLEEAFSLVNHGTTLIEGHISSGLHRPHVICANEHLIRLNHSETREFKSYIRKAKQFTSRTKKLPHTQYSFDPLSPSEKEVAVEVYKITPEEVETICTIVGQYSSTKIKSIFIKDNETGQIFDKPHHFIEPAEIMRIYSTPSYRIKSLLELIDKQKDQQKQESERQAKIQANTLSAIEVASWFIEREARGQIQRVSEGTGDALEPRGVGIEEVGQEAPEATREPTGGDLRGRGEVGGNEAGIPGVTGTHGIPVEIDKNGAPCESGESSPTRPTRPPSNSDQCLTDPTNHPPQRITRGCPPLGMTKLMCLLYEAQGQSLVQNGHPLFKEKIQAWKHGPAVKEVYNKFKDYLPIDFPNEQRIEPQYQLSDLELSIPERVPAILEKVYQANQHKTNEELCERVKEDYSYRKILYFKETSIGDREGLILRTKDIRLDFIYPR